MKFSNKLLFHTEKLYLCMYTVHIIFYFSVIFFTAVLGHISSFTVRAGDEVTLPCESLKNNQQKCGNTTWIWRDSGNTAAVELTELGQTGETIRAKSDRLSVTADCSLVIKKVMSEDVGRYSCVHFRPELEQGQSTVTVLSTVNSEYRLTLSVRTVY